MNQDKRKQFIIRLCPALIHKLRIIAGFENRSRQSLIEKILTDFAEKYLKDKNLNLE